MEGPRILFVYLLFTFFFLEAKETKPQETCFFRALQGGLFISARKLSDIGLSYSSHSEDIANNIHPPLTLCRLLTSVALVPVSRWHHMTFRNSWPSSLCYKCFKHHRRKEAGERFDSKVKSLSYDCLCCAQFGIFSRKNCILKPLFLSFSIFRSVLRFSCELSSTS